MRGFYVICPLSPAYLRCAGVVLPFASRLFLAYLSFFFHLRSFFFNAPAHFSSPIFIALCYISFYFISRSLGILLLVRPAQVVSSAILFSYAVHAKSRMKKEAEEDGRELRIGAGKGI